MSRELDDVNKRKKYREIQYGDKKSRVDDYTGKRVFKGNKKDAKYKHPSNKTSDTDHVTPIKVVEKRYKGLSKEQQRVLANNEHNYVITNSKLNRSKGDLENHEYLMKQVLKGGTRELETSVRMLTKEAESRVAMRTEATVMYTQNAINYLSGKTVSKGFDKINQAGLDEAMNSAMFASAISVATNVIEVIEGKVDVSDAVKDVLVDASVAAVIGYASGTIMEKMSLENGNASLLVAGTVHISKQIIAYVNGELNEQQFMDEIAETTVYLTSGYIGKYIGGIVGQVIIPIPVIGSYIGQYIGEIITTVVCSEVMSTIKFSKKFDIHNSKMISLYKKAEGEIRASQARLEYIIQKENNELIDTIRNGFKEIIEGIQSDTYEKVEKGIVIIGRKFGMTKDDFSKDLVTQETIFLNSDDTLIIE